ncbi:hypothetical protein GUJ93_ZPchr0004g39812 [Zizania palustris]|uniref:Protein kinase domain-containing protein n=1 Tax=Zizania palustris TaxID=103762 RepID=A0A8J5T1Y7_ZIZPA|nr:hypothetical protein GUJ93_ZPchr0004g39812 [Zizania palustris]
MRQIGAGLQVLSRHHVVHRDLKPEVFTNPNSNWFETPLLTDETLLCCRISCSLLLTAMPSSRYHLILACQEFFVPGNTQTQHAALASTWPQKSCCFRNTIAVYVVLVDLWSIGAILFELLNGYPPFRGRSNVQLLQSINSTTSLPFSKVVISKLLPDSIDICTRLLCSNPGELATS